MQQHLAQRRKDAKKNLKTLIFYFASLRLCANPFCQL